MHAGWRCLLPHRRTFSAPLLVGLPCPRRFCTPAGALCFLTGGHSQPFSSWGLALPSDFARRLGRSASSPAGIFSPSPRRAQPCPPGFCTPAGGVYFLSGGHSQPLSPWSCPPLLNFARRLEVSTSSLADILSPSPRGFSPPLPGFARRLGRSASSPADILSLSPRGSTLPSWVLHAGWDALLPHRRAFSTPLSVGLRYPNPIGGQKSPYGRRA